MYFMHILGGILKLKMRFMGILGAILRTKLRAVSASWESF